MVHGVERFCVVDGNSGRTGCEFALIEAYNDGGGEGKGGRRAVVVECLVLEPC